jgi:uncharacterized protein (TIGR03435 family)
MVLIFSMLAFQPAFEVATVKPTPPETRVVGYLGTYPGGRIRAINCTLEYLLSEAFDVRPFQISGGPNWIRTGGFDIDARPPADSKSIHANPAMPKVPMNDEQRQMLQTLLVERFQLKYHRDEREGKVYFLIKTNKKSKLEPAKDKDAFPWAGSPEGGGFGPNGVAGINITMPQLAARLSRALGRPVIDKTGIEGAYDFKSEYTADEANADRLTSILTSIQGLGLKLESGKGPVQTIVIDHLERPVEN